MTYDGSGNLLTVDGPLTGTADTTRFRYNAARQLVGVIGPDPDGLGSLKHRAVRTVFGTDGLPVENKLRNSFLLLAISIMCACDDRDIASMDAYEQVRSFYYKIRIMDADAILTAIAHQNGLEVNRDPHPRERALPTDYLVTILDDNCMIVARGRNNLSSNNFSISLNSVENAVCGNRMRTTFEEISQSLESRRLP